MNNIASGGGPYTAAHLSGGEFYDHRETKEDEDVEENIVKLPKLEIYSTTAKGEYEQLVVITPNSIDGHVKKQGEKVLFGRNDSRIKNDFSFGDESIGARQFEISYDKSIIPS
jgi:hypothetical protein